MIPINASSSRRRNAKSIATAALVLAAGWIAIARQSPSREPQLSQLVLPSGFRIGVYANAVQNAW